MSAEAFEDSTPKEVQWRIEAAFDGDDREWKRTAQLAAWVLNSLGANTTADKLLGKDKAEDGQFWF